MNFQKQDRKQNREYDQEREQPQDKEQYSGYHEKWEKDRGRKAEQERDWNENRSGNTNRNGKQEKRTSIRLKNSYRQEHQNNYKINKKNNSDLKGTASEVWEQGKNFQWEKYESGISGVKRDLRWNDCISNLLNSFRDEFQQEDAARISRLGKKWLKHISIWMGVFPLGEK
jgi:hypothetical protein